MFNLYKNQDHIASAVTWSTARQHALFLCKQDKAEISVFNENAELIQTFYPKKQCNLNIPVNRHPQMKEVAAALTDLQHDEEFIFVVAKGDAAAQIREGIAGVEEMVKQGLLS